MNRSAVCVVIGLLWAGVTGVTVWGQEIEWERVYSEEHPLSSAYYSGKHIEPMPDGGYVVTAVTGGASRLLWRGLTVTGCGCGNGA